MIPDRDVRATVLPGNLRVLYAFALLAAFTTAASAQAPASGAPAARALVNQYCTGCHNQKLKTADGALDLLDTSKVETDAKTWEKVLRKVSAGEMPPPKLPRPDAAAATAFTEWLGHQLDQAA